MTNKSTIISHKAWSILSYRADFLHESDSSDDTEEDKQ